MNVTIMKGRKQKIFEPSKMEGQTFMWITENNLRKMGIPTDSEKLYPKN
jgi:hypothetical protein